LFFYGAKKGTQQKEINRIRNELGRILYELKNYGEAAEKYLQAAK
jgi:hypothetical protein